MIHEEPSLNHLYYRSFLTILLLDTMCLELSHSPSGPNTDENSFYLDKAIDFISGRKKSDFSGVPFRPINFLAI